VTRHRGTGAIGEAGRIFLAFCSPVVEGDVMRQVVQRVVGARLVGDDVDRRSGRQQLGHHVGRVREHADRERLTLGLGVFGQPHRVGDVVGLDVQVAVFDAAGDA
jgi:hypothetical protein